MTNKSNTVKMLIKEFRQGDQSALERLMLLTYNDLFLLAYSYLKDKMLAEDVVSETFIKLIEKIHTVRSERNLNGFLRTLVINGSLDLLRKRRREVCLSDQDLSVRAGADNEAAVEGRASAREALGALRTVEREVLLLWYYGYTLSEISLKKGFTVNQTRLLLKKAKENFTAACQ